MGNNEQKSNGHESGGYPSAPGDPVAAATPREGSQAPARSDRPGENPAENPADIPGDDPLDRPGRGISGQQSGGISQGPPDRDSQKALSPYIFFSQEEWGKLRADTPLTLSESDLSQLRGINEKVSMDEVVEIYLPLSRLLNLYVAATQDLYRATATFLGNPAAKVPYVIGMAGSVAVGKSTTARILQALLSRWTNHPTVALVATDGFLYPNRKLEERGIMHRKGFPESYDLRALIQFVSDVKAGIPRVKAPVYSHLGYDIIPGRYQTVDQPDIMIVEGLNVLESWLGEPAQPAPDEPSAESSRGAHHKRVFVSDFFDFTIYVDARVEHIRQWYIDRFLALRNTSFLDPSSYFHSFAGLTDAEAVERSSAIWKDINERNLTENILPTRERAHLVLVKAADHSVESVRLRKI